MTADVDVRARTGGASPRALAARLASFGLAGTLHDCPQEPLDEATWTSLTRVVRQQRLTGMLTSAITAGAWPATPEQWEEALDFHVDATFGVLQLEWALLAVVEELAAAGVEARVLKGSAVAHLDYPRPHERIFGDVDLLVRGDDFDAAVATLTAAGYVRRFPQPRPGFDRRFSKGTSFAMPNGLELDLHRTFVMGPFGLLVDLEDVWTGHSEFQLAGSRLRGLSDEVRFLHACFHAALGDVEPRLVPQRDVVQMLLSGKLDVELVRTLMRRWQAEPVVARAVALSWETLAVADVVALSAWAQHYTPTREQDAFLSVYRDPRGSYAAKELLALRTIRGLRDKSAFLHALLFPERQYLTGRHSHRSQRLRRAWTAARESGVLGR